jgi:hypothetical protein
MKESYFVRSATFKFLSQMNGNSKSDFDFFLSSSQFVFTIGHFDYSPRVSRSLATPLGVRELVLLQNIHTVSWGLPNLL